RLLPYRGPSASERLHALRHAVHQRTHAVAGRGGSAEGGVQEDAGGGGGVRRTTVQEINATMPFTTSLYFAGVILPATDRMMRRSAVKTLLGRMLLSIGSPPEARSRRESPTSLPSHLPWLVIWQSITSAPPRSAMTRAGLRLLHVRSEKGNGITTTSPFIASPMPCPRPHPPSPSPSSVRSRWSTRPCRPSVP